MPIVSVIVPVYNVENYLEKCLESISNQLYKKIEILVIDDGSTDSSGYIADSYKQKDDRVTVLHQSNGGLSSARNSGLDIATGNYVCFIDSDDWIEPDFITLLLQGIEMYNADISVVKLKKISDYQKIEETTETVTSWEALSRNEAMKNLFTNNKIGYSANNKLFKRSLFSTIRFPKGFLMEDKATTYRLINESSVVVVNDSKKYHYYQSPNSILRGNFNPKKFDSFSIHEEIIEFIDMYYPEVSLNIRTRFVYESIRLMMSMIENNHEEKYDFDRAMNILSIYKDEIDTDEDFSKKLKQLSRFLLKHPNLPYRLSGNKVAAALLSKIETMR